MNKINANELTGSDLRALREQVELSQPEIANRMGNGGYTRNVISAIENNRRNIGLKLLISWAEACGYIVNITFEKKDDI